MLMGLQRQRSALSSYALHFPFQSLHVRNTAEISSEINKAISHLLLVFTLLPLLVLTHSLKLSYLLRYTVQSVKHWLELLYPFFLLGHAIDK